ncbi:MAG: MarR family transcriptional regulator [Bacteroidota bacterium]
MKLEQAIQQSDFTSNEHRSILNLIYTFNIFKENQKGFFKTFDITPQQFNVLRILRGRHPEPFTTSQIRERMLDKMSDASRIVDRLLKKKLVTRRTTKEDRRLVDVVISEQGLKLLDRIDNPLEDYMKNTFAGLSDNEINQLNKLLDKIRDND